MYSSSEHLFVSCGYDCNINVYDTRRNSMIQQHTQPHPMSTVCVSSCGTFCVAGNLKGDVISFDFRNMKQPLNSKRAHDGAVVRVAFIPTVVGSESNTMLAQSINATDIDSSGVKHSTPIGNSADSFVQFVDICRNVNSVDCNESMKRRDSWTDLISLRKPNDSCVNGTQSRLSMGSDFSTPLHHSFHAQQNNSTTINTSSIILSSDDHVDTSNIQKNKLKPMRRSRLTISNQNNNNNLQEIEEEQTNYANQSEEKAIEKVSGEGMSSLELNQAFAKYFAKRLEERKDLKLKPLKDILNRRKTIGKFNQNLSLSNYYNEKLVDFHTFAKAKPDDELEDSLDRRFETLRLNHPKYLKRNHESSLRCNSNVVQSLDEDFKPVEHLFSIFETIPNQIEN